MAKRITKTAGIDPNRYSLYDHETGELVPMDKSKKYYQSEELDLVKLHSKEYVTLDIERLNHLVVGKIETTLLGFLFKLVPFVQMASNKLISEGSIPHTSGSLAAVLGISQQNVKKNLDKLVEANLIALVPTSKRRERKCYVINPYMVRRGKGVSSLLPVLFNDPLPKALEKDWSKEPNLK